MIPASTGAAGRIRLQPQRKLTGGDVRRHVLTGIAVAELYRNQSKATGEKYVAVHW